MKVHIARLGLLVLSTSGCAFLDEVDRQIEQKAIELSGGALESKQPSTPAVPPPPAVPLVSAQPAPPPGTPTVAIKPAAIVQGTLSSKEATRIVERHQNELRFCYEHSATGDANVAITFVVSPSGAVQTAGIEQSDANDERLLVCLIEAVRRWTFPASRGGRIAVVTIPIELTRIIAGDSL